MIDKQSVEQPIPHRIYGLKDIQKVSFQENLNKKAQKGVGYINKTVAQST